MNKRSYWETRLAEIGKKSIDKRLYLEPGARLRVIKSFDGLKTGEMGTVTEDKNTAIFNGGHVVPLFEHYIDEYLEFAASAFLYDTYQDKSPNSRKFIN